MSWWWACICSARDSDWPSLTMAARLWGTGCPSGRWSYLVSEVRASSFGENARAVLRWPPLSGVVVLALFVFHAVNNWLWVNTNVTLMGWDRSSHLAKTLIYNDILQQINLRTAFTALTWPWHRPPLPFLSVVPFYRLFGISTDVALMSNCLYLAILLGSVYGIGRRLYGSKAGLLASFLVSFYRSE